MCLSILEPEFDMRLEDDVARGIVSSHRTYFHHHSHKGIVFVSEKQIVLDTKHHPHLRLLSHKTYRRLVNGWVVVPWVLRSWPKCSLEIGLRCLFWLIETCNRNFHRSYTRLANLTTVTPKARQTSVLHNIMWMLVVWWKMNVFKCVGIPKKLRVQLDMLSWEISLERCA